MAIPIVTQKAIVNYTYPVAGDVSISLEVTNGLW